MKTFGKLTRLGFALMVAAPLACRDGSSPETSVASSFDAAATRAALEVMDRVFGTAPWGGFRVLGARPPAFAPAGWIADGSTRLQFDVGVAVSSAAESVAVRFAFGIPERGFAATGAMRNVGSDSGGVGELGLAVQVGADLVEVNARGDRSAIDALFRVNGLLFARVLGDPASPAIRGEGGRELTPPEMQALGGIVAMAGGVFGIVQSLLQPAGALLNLGTI